MYGTGWYYRPWYSTYYYPRPCTWGFSMSYNPWYGFSMGMNVSCGGPFFNFNIHFGSSGYHPGYGGYYGGWCGCNNYRPPYHPPYGGWYGGRGPTINIDNSTNININNNNINNIVNNVNKTNNVGNLYEGNGWGGNSNLGNRSGNRSNSSARQGIAQTGTRPSTKDARTFSERPKPSARPSTGNTAGSRPANRPSSGGSAPNVDKSKVPQRPSSTPDNTKPVERPGSSSPDNRPSTRPTPSVPEKSKDVYADPAGNVYQKNKDSYKQTKPGGNGWTQPQSRPSTGAVNGRDLNYDAQSRQRANQRSQSYQSRPSTSGTGAAKGGRRR